VRTSWRTTAREDLLKELERQQGEIERQRRDLERLERERARWRRERERLRQKIDRLEDELDAARRAGFRQAAPFSKGVPAATPKRPGRKAGAAYGRPAASRNSGTRG
jgi:predicted  nucleic acid-binding Zn-ribbon protein